MNDLGRLLRTAARVSRTRYPGFIFGLPLARGEIPVFTYHDVETQVFARDLEFLRTNGYRTLSLDEYLAARNGGARPARAVLLTFDDARKSFFTVALPLLRTFDARAVLFAPAYWMTAPSQAADDLFMSWQEVRACVESGLVDVQSHAHRHALVATSPQLVDFAHPAALERFDIYDWPMRDLDGAEELGRPAAGTPIYRSMPLLSATQRYVENGELTQACREFVARRGGDEFFRQPDWRQQLTEEHGRLSERLQGRYLDDQAFRSLVASEFELSREQFRKNLGGPATSIAYPWMLGSPLSLELAKHHGLRTAFGVALDYRAERRSARLPIPVFGRLKCDWLQFLPGRQRSNVLAAVGRKLSGIAKLQHLAH
ncbi:MAG TPA: polysaccharide deacetylase family protein [Steroidobacteraceae bacterium]|nr:polysaccharide deacetylase family protein [Steroidobacteraceae bacterium]